MKARILALLAMVLGVVSCQTEPEGLDVNVGGDGVTTISVVLPEDAISRATAADETNSAWSGLENTKGETLRVILQVFDENGNTNANATLRQEQVLQEGVLTAYFDVRLVPNRKYTFVAWADQGADYFDATDLKNVKIVKDSWTAMNEYRDAFTATHTEASFSSASNITLNLIRPFAKLRVVTTDMEQLGHLDIAPAKAAVTYNVELPNAFNAFAGTIGTTTETKSFTFDIAEYNQDAAGTKTLFTDYVFVPADGVVKFNLDTKEADDRRIKLNQFNTDIPVKRNNLTTIQGNILTEGSHVTVTVDPVFENVENGTTTDPDYDYATISSEKEFMDAIKGTGGNYILISNLNLTGVYAQAAAATRTTTGPKTVNINLNGLTINVNNQTGNALVTLNDGDALIFSGEGEITTTTGSGDLVDNTNGTVVVTGAVTGANDVTTQDVLSGLEALVYICENGGEFNFTENLDTTDRIDATDDILIVSATNPVVINGNGFTLTSTAARAINVSGAQNVTIKNLNIVASGERAINVIQNAKNVTIENVTATAANYTVNVAGSAPNAVVAIKNSTLNGLCTVNVGAAGATVTVDGSTVNCNDNNTTEGESYAALCLNKAAVGAKIIATNSTINVTEGSDSTKGRNGAEDGEVTINGGVEGVVVMNAVINPNNDYYYSFETIQAAVEFAKSGDKISLIRNVELTEPLIIDGKTITIDLNGKTITGTGCYVLITNGGDLTITGGEWDVVAYTKIDEGLYQNGVKYLVMNAEGLATLNTMMANKKAGQNVVVKLAADIDFAGKTWTPVDSHADSAFSLTEIDGQGHTISNLTINGQAMFTRFAGFGDVTIKNITFDNATVNGSGINTSILTGHTYQNVLLDNVDVKKSSITGGYKVAPLIGTVYNENPSTTITATLKNCDVENVTVKATSYDFCTTGMVAFVYADDNDTIAFENCSVKNVKLYAPNVYTAHAAIYTEGSETLYNEADGVVVENVTFENI